MFLLFMPFLAICLLLVALFYSLHDRQRTAGGEYKGRRRTLDISFLAQSPIGFIGRITRTVPAPKITPEMNDITNPVLYFGLAVLMTASNTVRSILASDAGLSGITGIAVQPFPYQAASASNYGAQAFSALSSVPPGVLDVNRSGMQVVYCNSADAPSATKVDKVYAWCAASNGTHVQGGFERTPSAAAVNAATVGNTGDGTMTAGPTIDATKVSNGAYSILFTDATHFNVIGPDGKELKPGQTGVAYSDAGLGFTITAGGTAFVAGDSFTVTVTFSTIPVPNAYFNGAGDSTGAIELAFNL